MDFTLKQYIQLIQNLQNVGFHFQTFADYISQNENKCIILRHDVDDKPKNSLRFAYIQSEFKIKGTYYFRIISKSFDRRIIEKIASMGHEIGYHYETMDACNGNIDSAYNEFCINLETFRKVAEIRTISMHGSPLSKYDNRAIWEKYDYKSLGIIGEPYFDLDFNQILYITDTGRRWNGNLFNVRDKAIRSNPIINPEFLKLNLKTTSDIISSIRSNSFPNQSMMNFHPQRWSDRTIPWIHELIMQNSKNMIKYYLIRMRDK
jgi:hypothetical protein